MCPEHDRATLGVVSVGETGKCAAFDFDEELLARFDFDAHLGQDTVPCVSPAKQRKFLEDFERQFRRVREQLGQYKDKNDEAWLSPDALLLPRVISGPYRPRTNFLIFVSESYAISRSLIPAWLGQRGWFEFPAHRVAAGEAAVAHEVVHVLFPTGNRMLAEGLAVYLQHKLFPDIPAFPNFGAPLERLLEGFLQTYYPASAPDAFWSMDLECLERIPTPDKLCLRIGGDIFGAKPGVLESPPDQEKAIYAVAGSFVGFLLENPIKDGLLTEENFGEVYKSTPLRPLERDQGSPDRWQDCYSRQGKSCYSFSDLGLLWKTYMHAKLFNTTRPAGGKDPKPIPEIYARIPLVASLHDQIRTGQ
jgi:hypothetical protein